MTMKEKAQTIISQMGGTGKLMAMVGVKRFIFSEEKQNVSFKFKGSRKSNHITITINSLDLYDVEFSRITENKKTYETNIKKINEYNGLYWDQLKPVFEQETGLYLSL